jgi:hypothetical protein
MYNSIASLRLGAEEVLQVDLRNKEGKSLLWIASSKGFAGVVLFCLQLKADGGLRDTTSGRSCLEVAKTSKCKKLIAKGLGANYCPPTFNDFKHQ